MARFIVFEGIDGSGKSSVVHSIRSQLNRRDFLFTEEPTKSWLGDAVRRSHSEEEDALTEAFLFMADRASHNLKISQWLSEEKNVICDRYYHSTVAYQGAALEGKVDFDPFEFLFDINRQISIEPDLVFFFEVDPAVAIERVNRRKALSKFEELEFLRKVARNYSRMAKICNNVVVIDSSGPLQTVIDDVMGRLQKQYLNPES